MHNKKGIELAISTLILIALGILVLIGLIYAVTGGFKKFKASSDPLLDSAEGSAIKQACEIACAGQDRLTFCCKNFTLGGSKLFCSDRRLELSCELNCESYSCS